MHGDIRVLRQFVLLRRLAPQRDPRDVDQLLLRRLHVSLGTVEHYVREFDNTVGL